MVTRLCRPEELLVTVNVPVKLPTATGTLAGTETADGSLDESTTVAPPAGVRVFKVTVAVVDSWRPSSDAPRSSESAGQARTPIVVLTRLPSYLAVSLTVSVRGVGGKVNVKLPVREPAGTVTVAGGIRASGSLLVRETSASPGGANPLSSSQPGGSATRDGSYPMVASAACGS